MKLFQNTITKIVRPALARVDELRGRTNIAANQFYALMYMAIDMAQDVDDIEQLHIVHKVVELCGRTQGIQSFFYDNERVQSWYEKAVDYYNNVDMLEGAELCPRKLGVYQNRLRSVLNSMNELANANEYKAYVEANKQDFVTAALGFSK